MTKVNREWSEDIARMVSLYYMDCGANGFVKSNPSFEKIIDYISTLISQTRNDLLREIMEEMPKKIDENDVFHFGIDDVSPEDTYNQALDQVNTLLERKLSTVKK